MDRGRVCFLCYQKAVAEDISARKEIRKDDNIPNQHSDCNENEETKTGGTKSFESGGSDPDRMDSQDDGTSGKDHEDEWPVVSVEMGSRYKIMSQDLEKLFILECRYVRQVRWNGIADAGRIMIKCT